MIGTKDDGRPACGWGHDGHYQQMLEDYLVRAVEQTRRMYHVHSERIYFAGVNEGATEAYRLALAMPDRVAGVIALNGSLPQGGPLFRMAEIRNLKVFIGHGIANVAVPLTHRTAERSAALHGRHRRPHAHVCDDAPPASRHAPRRQSLGDGPDRRRRVTVRKQFIDVSKRKALCLSFLLRETVGSMA